MNFITPVDVTPGTTGGWTDVDVSAHIPSGATGVILHFVNNETGYSSICKIRKKGSSDDISMYVGSASHNWGAIGVDANRVFQAYIGSYAKIYLVGYFESNATFKTNATVKQASADDTWTTLDLTSDTSANATAAIFLIPDSSPDEWGIRKYGSSDNRYGDSNSLSGFIVGLDSSQRCQVKSADYTDTEFYLVGYIENGAVMNTNATDKSLSTTGSFQDITLPAGAIGALIEVYSSSTDLKYALRKNGSSENIYLELEDMHGFAIVEADSNGKIEGKIENTSVDFYLVGYFETPVSPSSSVSPSISPSASVSPSSSVSPSPSSTPSPSISPSSSQSPSASLSPSASVSPSSSVSSSPSSSVSASPSPAAYGLMIKKGDVSKDVDEITDPKEFAFWSARSVLGIHTFDTVTASTDAGGDINTTDNHGIGYTPVTMVTFEAYDGTRVVAPAEWRSFYQNGLAEVIEVIERVNFKIDGTKIRIIVHAEEYNHDTFTTTDLSSRSYTFDILYFFNELTETT